MVLRDCVSVPRDSMCSHPAGPFGLQMLVTNQEIDTIQLREVFHQHLLWGGKFYQEVSSSGVSGCEDGP